MYVAVLFLMMQGLKEYNEALKNKNNTIYPGVLSILAVIMFICNVLSEKISVRFYLMFICFYLITVCVDLIMVNRNISIKKRLLFWLGITYILVGFESMILIRNFIPKGEFFTWMIFVITVISDSMAYFAGKLFGKRKLIPSVSPNKTVEGSLGAIIFTIIGCVLYGLTGSINVGNLVVIGLLGSITSQCGDLIASKLKRYVGIKDFSNLIPQHGGVLDRLDSALLVSQFMIIVLLVLI